MEFCTALEGGTVAEAEALYNALLADLYHIQAYTARLHAMSDAFEREQAAYAEKQAQLQASIEQVGIRSAGGWAGRQAWFQAVRVGRRADSGGGSQWCGRLSGRRTGRADGYNSCVSATKAARHGAPAYLPSHACLSNLLVGLASHALSSPILPPMASIPAPC